MRGWTPTETAALRPFRQLAWYAVAIRGRARYVHTPSAPLSTVATERNEPLPYVFEKTTTCSPAVCVGTVPVSLIRPPNTTWRAATVRLTPTVANVRSAPYRVPPSLFATSG